MNEILLLKKQIDYLEKKVIELEQDKKEYKKAFLSILNKLTQKEKSIKVDEEEFQEMLKLAYEIDDDDDCDEFIKPLNPEFAEIINENLFELAKDDNEEE